MDILTRKATSLSYEEKGESTFQLMKLLSFNTHIMIFIISLH